MRTAGQTLLVGFRVSPSAARTRIQGTYGDRVKVQVAAPPEKGKANEELVRALSSWLDVPSALISVQSGEKGRDKVIAFSGISAAALRRWVDELTTGEFTTGEANR